MKLKLYPLFPLLVSLIFFSNNSSSQHSVAREWNETILFAISKDFARPTVHARNLFHMSAVMYDAWAVYEEGAQTYILGQNLHGYTAAFNGVPIPENIQEAREEAISFAAFRIISHRYANSPGLLVVTDSIQNLMDSKGYDYSNASVDYANGGPAEMGNYIAKQLINYGFTDGANEGGEYANTYYSVLNPPIEVEEPGNPDIIDPNRWQQISLTVAIDQAGQPVEDTPPFLSPEWGDVNPFSMTEDDATVFNRDGHDYKVYHDPGDPAFFIPGSTDGLDDPYKWNHLLVSIWGSHLTTDDNVMWDASPNSIGNIPASDLPDTQEEMVDFYNLFEGGDPGTGYDLNPITGMPYETQMVPRGDYARVLAEFWADGPNSVTPPGHWFDILNHVADHPLFERKWMGTGPELPALEYDVKSYLAMGGAMHDAAIASWSIKGYYDYLRPVSAIRFMADNGQCTDSGLPNYNLDGVPLIPGYIELVEVGDPLAGDSNEHVGKVKLYTWKGPDYIEDPDTDIAGVDWILGENWWPYQRPSFVTPPFAGYVSGHSTYSRAAAELMTLMTGSAYFPGGMSAFVAEQNEFLVFEDGPSQNIELQWATYRDASDQCSLSRIWGGIHPPIDDIPGRKIGLDLGPDVFMYADNIVNGTVPYVSSIQFSDDTLSFIDNGNNVTLTADFSEEMDPNSFPVISFFSDNPTSTALTFVSADWIDSDTYQFSYDFTGTDVELTNIVFGLSDALNIDGKTQIPFAIQNALYIDNKVPVLENVTSSLAFVSDETVEAEMLFLTFEMSESCDVSESPSIALSASIDPSNSAVFNPAASYWNNGNEFVAAFDLIDEGIEVDGIDAMIDNLTDNFGNLFIADSREDLFSIDTKNPSTTNFLVSDPNLNQMDQGGLALTVNITFDQVMNTAETPSLIFFNEDPLASSLVLNNLNSVWISDTECQVVYDLIAADEELLNIGVSLENFMDLNGNTGSNDAGADLFSIDTKTPEIVSIMPLSNTIADANIGSEGFSVEVVFTENMNESQVPLISFSGTDLSNSLQYEIGNSQWQSPTTFLAYFLVTDLNIEVDELSLDIDFATDAQGNPQTPYEAISDITLDTRNPVVLSVSASTYNITNNQVGEDGFNIVMIFDEEMDQLVLPSFAFTPDEPASSVFSVNDDLSFWLNPFTYKAVFDVADVGSAYEENLTINITDGADFAGNSFDNEKLLEFLTIEMGSVGITEYNKEALPVLFPSPAKSGESLSLKINQLESDVLISIYDSKGVLTHSLSYDQLSPGTIRLPLPSLAGGIYIFSFQSDQSQSNSKIIIN